MLSAFVVSVVGLLLLCMGWDWLRSETQESRGTTIRNAFLIIGGLVAVLLAIWRSRVSERQTQIANDQAETARKQADTAQQSLLNERYQRGAEMLGSDVLAVRLGGIYSLENLAKDHSAQYHILVMKLFCAFVRDPTLDEVIEPNSREDVRAVLTAIGSRYKERIRIERSKSFRLNLNGIKLPGAILHDFDLSNSDLNFADLSEATLIKANLSNSHLQGATLSNANFLEADLSGAHFSVEGVYPAIGLTQAQLDRACSYRSKLPKLDGVLDAEKGIQLEPPTNEPGWRDRLSA